MTDYSEIFGQFKKGNLHPFYTEMYPGVILYAMHILGEDMGFVAEDCVQDAVMTTYVRRTEFTSAGLWRGFLLACVRYNAIAVLRKHSHYQDYADRLDMDESEADYSFAMIRHELHELLYNAIANLPEKYREIFRLSFQEGLKNTEIAETLGIAEITVKKRKARMIELLRDCLGDFINEQTLLWLTTLALGSDCFTEYNSLAAACLA